MTPTKIYAKEIGAILNKHDIHGLSHITGGGLFENVPRILGENVDARIDVNKLPKKEIFSLLQQWGDISTEEMYGTFNMGVGMILVVDKNDYESIVSIINELDEEVYVVGEIVEGSSKVVLI